MSLPIPISVQANRLEKYGIDSDLKEEFFDITNRCKRKANTIKADKASLEAVQKSYESDKAYLASRGFTLSPSEIMKRRAFAKSLQATKKHIKRRKYEIKNDKLDYKRLVEQRKALRKKIKEKYEANKDKIKEIKDDKWRERREKLKEMGIIVADTAQEVGKGVVDTANQIGKVVSAVAQEVGKGVANAADKVHNVIAPKANDGEER